MGVVGLVVQWLKGEVESRGGERYADLKAVWETARPDFTASRIVVA